VYQPQSKRLKYLVATKKVKYSAGVPLCHLKCSSACARLSQILILAGTRLGQDFRGKTFRLTKVIER
jgi:hypothetical protein